MTIAPTKYWHMALSNPSLADATEFCDKLNETAFCLYGHDTTFTGYLLEAFVVFKSRKSAESVKRMFSKATVSRIRYVFEAMDAIESYENCVRVGQHPFEEIKSDLEAEFELEWLDAEARKVEVIDLVNNMPTPGGAGTAHNPIILDADAPVAPRKRTRRSGEGFYTAGKGTKVTATPVAKRRKYN